MFQTLALFFLALSPAHATAPKQVCFLRTPLRYISEAPGAVAAHVFIRPRYRRENSSFGNLPENQALVLVAHPFRNGGSFFSMDLDTTFESLVYERSLMGIEIEAEILYQDGTVRRLNPQYLVPEDSAYSPLRCELHAS